MNHLHREAYCVMVYRSKAGGHQELLWNSRDGVTPFMVLARDGRTMLQESGMRYAPDYQPLIGDRIFVDMTLERLIEYKRRMVDSEWDNPEFHRIVVDSLAKESDVRPNRAAVAYHLARREFERHPGGPDLIEVTEGVLEWLKGHRLKAGAE